MGIDRGEGFLKVYFKGYCSREHNVLYKWSICDRVRMKNKGKTIYYLLFGSEILKNLRFLFSLSSHIRQTNSKVRSDPFGCVRWDVGWGLELQVWIFNYPY